jgi:hypothetical protein
MYDNENIYFPERLRMQSCHAVIIIGLPRRDIINIEILEEDMMESFPAYYDGTYDPTAIIGIEYERTARYSSMELNWDDNYVNSLKNQFFTLSGQEAKIYLSTNVV